MDLQASLTPQEVSELLKITKNTVYELIKRGELPSYKIGKKIRIDMHDVEAYINNQKNSLKITDSKNISSTSRRNAQITNNSNSRNNQFFSRFHYCRFRYGKNSDVNSMRIQKFLKLIY